MSFLEIIIRVILIAIPAILGIITIIDKTVRLSWDWKKRDKLAPQKKNIPHIPTLIVIASSAVGFVASMINLFRFPDVLSNKWDIAVVAFTVFFLLINLLGFIANLYEWIRERR